MATLARRSRPYLLMRHALTRTASCCPTDSSACSFHSFNHAGSCQDQGEDHIAAVKPTQLGFTTARGAISRLAGSHMRKNNFAVSGNQYPERGVRHYRGGGGRGRGRTFHDFDREYGQPGENKGSRSEGKDETGGLGSESRNYKKMDFEEQDASVPESPEERVAYMREREREIMLRKFRTQVIDVNRTFKVTKGGGEISFTALVICGNGDGLAGWGKGKGPKATRAIREASAKAINNLYYFERFKDQTIYHYVEAKYEKTKVRLWPEWTLGKFRAAGIVKGILRMAGISCVKSKLIGSSNPHNTVKATFLALSKIKTPKEYEEKYWRAVVERHLILDDEGNPHPEYRKISSYVL